MSSFRLLVALVLTLAMLLKLSNSFGFARRTSQGLSQGKLGLSLLSSSLFSSTSSDTSSASSTTESGSSVNKLDLLREYMSKEGMDAFIVPTDDPHMSEYCASYYARREYISGFTGSAGTAVITMDNALLFTDGRYHDQAELELDSEKWTLMKQGIKGVPSIQDYLVQNLAKTGVVGLDPDVHCANNVQKLEQHFSKDGNSLTVKMLPSNSNLVDQIWNSDNSHHRPARPQGAIRIHPDTFAGETVKEKLTKIRDKLHPHGGEEVAKALISSSLDEIAYIFNIRGSDIPCNPVAISYGMITMENAYLFIDESKMDTAVRTRLEGSGVTILPYTDIIPKIQHYAGHSNKIWMDSKTINCALFNSVHAGQALDRVSPIILMKACKNKAELQGMVECHERDGAAMAEMFSHLELLLDPGHKESETEKSEREALGIQPGVVTEVDIDTLCCHYRSQIANMIEPSFPTIAGMEGNGAIIHYSAKSENCKSITTADAGRCMILLDSGGQYVDGTTDVTRTFHTGTPSTYEKEMWTRVLKGNIGVDKSVFPAGTAGCLLDSFAREHLWAIGKDYIHGTGHGVGAALNVHEGPHRISRMLDGTPLQPGMVVSNEPGYYEVNKFGIRLENLLYVVEREEKGEFGGRKFYGFNKLTLIPLQLKCIQWDLMTPVEKEWLDAYHSDIRKRVLPLVQTERGKAWLMKATVSCEEYIDSM